jgi:drug/metabolite transporter (DMT)-like permease
MTAMSLGLVLLSALAHSSWNLLLKRSEDKEVFVWWLLVAASVTLAPLGVVLLWLNPIQPPGWWLVLATVVLHTFYFVLLGRGYAQGDLSLVYPIARGMGPMLVPVLAVLVLGEEIHSLAVVGIIAIVVGIYTISWWGSFNQLLRRPLTFLSNGGTRYAVLTGLTIAVYALIDKRGVGYVQPFLYMYLMTLGSAAGLAPYVLWQKQIAAIKDEWRSNSRPIFIAGLLTFLAYGLVLTAFSLSRVSYVAPAREVGIVFGVLMGIFILKEPFGVGRLLGSCLILAGLTLIAVSP